MSREFSAYYSSAYRSDGNFLDWRVKSPDQAENNPKCLPYNLISFLSLIADMEVDIYQVTWDGKSSMLGVGGTAVISQTVLREDEGMAFKRVGARGEDPDIDSDDLPAESRVFKALISEVSILTHPAIRNHPGIIDLEAICFETDFSYSTPKILPVLMFQKAQLGDLGAFFDGKASIKVDVAMRLLKELIQTVADLHSKHLIHGDIKPKNILVFENEEGQPMIKLADFGYSLQETDTTIKLPVSMGWNAPEVTSSHPDMTLPQAQKADIFSLGLVALWLLQRTTHASDVQDTYMQGSESVQDRIAFAEQQRARWHITSDHVRRHGAQTYEIFVLLEHIRHITSDDQSRKMQSFFGAALAPRSEERANDCFELLEILQLPVSAATHTEETIEVHDRAPSLCGTFRIAPLMSLIADLDYRIRRRVNDLLYRLVNDSSACSNCSQNAALQLAACSKLGFGMAKDDNECIKLLKYSGGTNEEFESILQAIIETGDGVAVNNPKVLQLVLGGHLEYVWSASNLRHLTDLDTSIEILESELASVAEFLGHTHTISYQLCSELGDIYERRLDFARWAAMCERIIPHFDEQITQVQAQTPEDEVENPRRRRAKLLLNLATAYFKTNRASEALDLAKTSLDEWNTFIGEEGDLNVRATKLILVLIYSELGSYEKATELLEQIIESESHPTHGRPKQLQSSLQYLAELFEDQREYSKAKEKLLLALELATKNPGTSITDLMQLNHRLGSLYYNSGDLNKSWTHLDEVKKFWENYGDHLGQVAPEYVVVLIDLVDTLQAMERSEEALPMALDCVRLSKTFSPELHELSVRILINVRCAMGKLDGLETIALNLVESSIERHGPDDSTTLARQNHYGYVLAEQDRYEEAEKILRPTVRAYGDTGLSQTRQAPYYVATWNLANALRAQEKWEEAVKYFSLTVELSSEIYGKDHPEYWGNEDDLADVRSKGGDWNHKLTLRLKAAEAAKKAFGETSVQVLNAMIEVAEAHFKLFDFRAGKEIYETIVPMQVKICGQNSGKTLRLKGNLAFSIGMIGFMTNDMEKRKEALTLMEENYAATIKMQGEGHEDSRKACDNLMWSYTMLGHHKEASRMLTILESLDQRGCLPTIEVDQEEDEWETDSGDES